MESVWVVTESRWYEYTKVIGVCATKELAEKLMQQETQGKDGFYRREYEHAKTVQYNSSDNQMTYNAEEMEIQI